MQSTDVLVVGAGPTGLMAANQLQHFGVDFLIIDSKSCPTKESRAIGVSARSMEVYQQLGLDDKIIKRSVKVNGFHLYSNGNRKATIRFDDMGEGLSDFPYMMFIFEQSKNETLLYENLLAHNNDVMWNTSFLELNEYACFVDATIQTESGTDIVRAKYVIGCDGARSPVRQQKDFTFKGGTYENRFYVADVKNGNSFDHDKLLLAPSDTLFTAFFPMEGEGVFRMVGTLPEKHNDKADVTFDEIKEGVSLACGLNLKYEAVNWFSIYKLHHRCVDSFTKGRIHLAGDSAHIHSPAGGQGMNTGLQDAHNLAWKLAYHLKGHAKASLLNTYNEERLPFAKWLLGFTDRGFTLMSSRDWWTLRLRKYIMLNIIGFMFKMKKVRARMFAIFSQTKYDYADSSLSLSNSQQKLTFKAGQRLPYLEPGYYTKFSASSFHLLHISNEKMSIETQKKIQGIFSFPIQIVDELINDDWKKLGVRSELFILIRPDTHIAYIADDSNVEQWKHYLKSILRLIASVNLDIHINIVLHKYLLSFNNLRYREILGIAYYYKCDV